MTDIMTGAVIREIPVGFLSKPGYQRPLRDNLLRKMRKNFEPALIGVLTVSVRDDKLYVVDGWHRRTILDELYGPDQPAVCEVHQGMTEKEEEELFTRLNLDRVRLSSLDSFAADLHVGDPRAVAINDIAVRNGMRVGGHAHNAIRGPAVLARIYDRDGAAGLDRVLRTAAEAYGPAGAVNATFIDGLGIVYNRYGDKIKDRRMAQRLAGTGTAARLLGLARGVGSGHGERTVANAIIEIYNWKLKDRLPVLVRTEK